MFHIGWSIVFEELSKDEKSENSSEIRKRVVRARNIQTERFQHCDNVNYNAQMNKRHIEDFCKLSDIEKDLLKRAMDTLNLSARAYDRILKVSRTIADLEGLENIQVRHLTEAIQYRSLDREGWMR
ncbi:magnesium chelatase [Ichthyobacterium seriolicida]|uniref:Magnesium chelatase n=1 Tax=Ichthyobacterium seriolicida TaxID=242600 RepID=A0A1J1EAR5_9FLAO|nr:magnesium chelatase [Ichthyobacterium seriolicida]